MRLRQIKFIYKTLKFFNVFLFMLYLNYFLASFLVVEGFFGDNIHCKGKDVKRGQRAK